MDRLHHMLHCTKRNNRATIPRFSSPERDYATQQTDYRADDILANVQMRNRFTAFLN